LKFKVADTSTENKSITEQHIPNMGESEAPIGNRIYIYIYIYI